VLVFIYTVDSRGAGASWRAIDDKAEAQVLGLLARPRFALFRVKSIYYERRRAGADGNAGCSRMSMRDATERRLLTVDAQVAMAARG
jgi:hypothetical protein